MTITARLSLFLVEEALDDLRYTLERREGDEDNALCRCRACAPFGVDVERRLFVEPHDMHGVGLPLPAALIVGLEEDRRRAARHMPHHDSIERVGCSELSVPVEQRVLWNCACAPRALVGWSADQQSLHAVARKLGAF